MKPKGKVNIEWSSDFAYAIGLIVSDGNLSPSGRHIVFTTKDEEQANTYKRILKLTNTIGRKSNGRSKDKKYYVIQFGDVQFYSFLSMIGIHPAKSKNIGVVDIPEVYFFDFLRGTFDGDGCTYSYWDPRWKKSFLFYLAFSSASLTHITWLRGTISTLVGVAGHVSRCKNCPCYQLRFGKREAVKVIRKMYRVKNSACLSRKKLKINQSLAIMDEPSVE